MSKEQLINSETQFLVLARLHATGHTTVSAISSSYDDEFPPELDGIVSRKEFKFCIEVINETAEDFFPCLPCYATGYLCCLSTCGVSLLCPEPCTREWEENVDLVLRRINQREDFLYRGIVWRLERSKKARVSWIEVCQIIYE